MVDVFNSVIELIGKNLYVGATLLGLGAVFYYLKRLTRLVQPRSPIISTRKYTIVSPINGKVTIAGICVAGNRIYNHVRITRNLLSDPIQYMPANGSVHEAQPHEVDAPQLYPQHTRRLSMSIRSKIGKIFILQNLLWHKLLNYRSVNKTIDKGKDSEDSKDDEQYHDEKECGIPIGLFPFSKNVDILIPAHLVIIVEVGDDVIGGTTPIAVTCRDYDIGS